MRLSTIKCHCIDFRGYTLFRSDRDVEIDADSFMMKVRCRIWYPLLWIVSPDCMDIISMDVNDFLHMLLDVCAKSLYGACRTDFPDHCQKKAYLVVPLTDPRGATGSRHRAAVVPVEL